MFFDYRIVSGVDRPIVSTFLSDELGKNEVLLDRMRARVVVKHVDLFKFLETGRPTADKATVASVYAGNSLIAESVALCHPNDNFSRKIGRKVAALRLNEQLKAQGFSAGDRGAVFDIVCPKRCKATRVPGNE